MRRNSGSRALSRTASHPVCCHGLRVLLASLALLAGVAPVRAATNVATATIVLTATFIKPPCSLAVPTQVMLGDMPPDGNAHGHAPLSVQITCWTPMDVALYAEVVQGSLTTGRTDRMDMTGPVSTGTPAQLWLTSPSDGKDIVLDGSGATDPGHSFCRGTTTRECVLQPTTQAFADTPRGLTRATLRLSVMYP